MSLFLEMSMEQVRIGSALDFELIGPHWDGPSQKSAFSKPVLILLKALGFNTATKLEKMIAIHSANIFKALAIWGTNISRGHNSI